MSLYYKPNRKPDWNYGGPRWRLSRSKIALFGECARCFYIDNKLGVARPPGFPFNLNSAVDALFKKEFDTYRADGTVHPLMVEYKIDAVPFKHANMDVWRENFKGMEVKHAPTGFTVSGAVDDIWVNKAGELMVVDYKATSKDSKIETLDETWHEGYKRQMEIYQWLLRQLGFKVSDTGYIVYANAQKDRDSFGAKLEFDVTLIAHKGSTDWVDATLLDIKKCLDSGVLPAPSDDCDHCRYREAAGRALLPFARGASIAAPLTEKSPVKPTIKKRAIKNQSEETHETAQLF
jgi:hypothetical protein